MFDDWCDIDETTNGARKTLFKLSEKQGGREAVTDQLLERVRSHYEDLDRIAEDIERLGYPRASAILQERLPRSARARSGELGEILATEFIEFEYEFRIPVRRLRYKDGREMPLRGDDFLGVDENEEQQLLFLKGEAKSGQWVAVAVVDAARKALSENEGRPTPISLLFVADRLMEAGGDDENLGRRIRDEIALRAVPAQRITHGLFTLSGNIPAAILEDDLDAADERHSHISMNLHVADHQNFIAQIYEKAGNLGDG